MSYWLTVSIFILIYIFIAVQRFPFIKIDRPAGVFTGVTLLTVAGVVTLEEGYGFIDWNVITFLLGMMIMVAYLQISGFFGFAAEWIIKLCKTPQALLSGIMFFSAILSALFVNDTVCLLFTPIVISSCRNLKISPVPYLIALALSANIGSALTITGNPQNMFIGIQSGMNFITFMKYTFVPVIFSLLFAYFAVFFIYRKEMVPFSKKIQKEDNLKDKALMIKSLSVLSVTIILFVAGVSYPLAALIGASAIILLAGIRPAKMMEKIDWPILLFFAGLFIIMGAFDKAGYTAKIMSLAGGGLSDGSLKETVIFSGTVVLLSNMVSNLPAVILFMPAAEGERGAALLALVSTFAGNFTLVGSVANLIVAEIAEGKGFHISFRQYMKTGAVVTLFSCTAAVLWIYFTR